MAKIADMLVRIGADTKDLKKGLTDAQKSIKTAFNANPVNEMSDALVGTSDSLGSLIGKFSSLATLAAGGFGFFSLIDSAVKAGESAYNLSERLGVSAAEAGKFSKILSLTGSNVDVASTAIMRMDKTLTSGGKSAESMNAVFNAVGVSMTDTHGKLLPLNEQLAQLAKGYKTAEEAGRGQEYLLETLGSRGLALADTLRDYDEAAEKAGKIKGVGLDPAQMHEINDELELVKMQAGQLGVAFGSVLAPIVGQYIPPLVKGLGEVASWLAKNKEEVGEVTEGVLTFIAVYKGLMAMQSMARSAGSLMESLGLSGSTEAIEAKLTANQERQIEKRIRAIETQELREEAAQWRTLQKSNLTEEEKTAKYIEFCEKRALATEATEAKIRASMTATYAQINAQATESAVVQSTASAGAEAAAVTSSAKAVAAKAGETAAAEQVAVATEQATVKAVEHGTTVSAMGGKAIGVMGKMTQAAVALAGGWEMVALAAAVALVQISKAQGAKIEESAKNTWTDSKGRTWGMDSDGTIRQMFDGGKWGETGHFEKYLTAAEQHKVRNQLTYQANYKQEQKTKNEQAKIAADTKKQMAEIEKQLGSIGKNVGTSAKNVSGAVTKNTSATNANTAKLQSVQVPVGQIALRTAQSHPEGEQWMGKFSKNTALQCASFLADSYEKAGIKGLNTGGALDMANRFKAKGAFYNVNSGYVAHAGDTVLWRRKDGGYHVGMADGSGGYIARNSRGGVHRGKLTDTFLGSIVGYGSISKYTGGKTVGVSMSDGDKAIEDAQAKLNQAKQDAETLFNEMDRAIADETETEYAQSMDKLAEDLQSKQQKINEIQAAGVDSSTIKTLTDKLAEYQAASQAKIVEKQKNNLAELVNETQKIHAELKGDYKALADAEYNSTVLQLKAERKEKEKAVAKDKDDKEAMAAVDAWYTEQVAEAVEKRAQAYREASEKQAKYAIDNHRMDMLKSLISGGDFQSQIDWDGQTKAFQTYYDLLTQANISLDEQFANIAKDATGSFKDFFDNVLEGSESLADALLDLFTNLGETILSQFTEQWASQISSSIFGGWLGKQGQQNDNSDSSGTAVSDDNPLAIATQGMANGLNNATGLLGTFGGALGQGQGLLTGFNMIQSVLNTGTKPAEATSTIAATSALTGLTASAMSASAALSSVSVSGGGGGLFGALLHRADGGPIVGAGTATSDSIPAMLSNGEYVLNAKAVKRVGRPLLDAINYGHARHFASGGLAARSVVHVTSGNRTSNPVVINVSAIDADSFRGFIKTKGKRVIRQALYDDVRDFKTESGVW